MVTAEWVTDASQESNGHPKSIRITSITDPLGIYRGTVWFTIIDVWFTIIDFTLWLFNITMENEPFIDDVPIRMVIYWTCISKHGIWMGITPCICHQHLSHIYGHIISHNIWIQIRTYIYIYYTHTYIYIYMYICIYMYIYIYIHIYIYITRRFPKMGLTSMFLPLGSALPNP